jgi:hypothetical protein
VEVVERFPFGAPIQPVTWQQAGPKPVLIIGVYPSAVHARWVDGDGRTRIRAVAVANEPEPFWTGQDAEHRVAAVAATVPTVVGRLVGVPGHNGPSGQALEASVLAPLGLDRDRIRVADIDNRYMANPAQQQALERCYNLLAAKGLLSPVSWRLRRPITKVPADRSPNLAEELEEASPDWVITLGDEPLRALRLRRLSPDNYGVPLAASIFGRSVRLLRLVHTRQQAQHGASSRAWAQLHQQWAAGAGAATVRRAISASL